MDPSVAADEKRQEECQEEEELDLDLLLSALQRQMDNLMTLAKDAVAFAGDTDRPRKDRKRKRR
jgi:hypothetical protein